MTTRDVQPDRRAAGTGLFNHRFADVLLHQVVHDGQAESGAHLLAVTDERFEARGDEGGRAWAAGVTDGTLAMLQKSKNYRDAHEVRQL